jgi:Uncharacterized protein conserved in bacteria
VAHFEDLTRAHEAVQRAQAQLTALGPLLAECDAHDKVAAEITALTAQRNALRYFFADLKAGLGTGCWPIFLPNGPGCTLSSPISPPG